MKRFLLIALAIAVGGFLFHQYLQNAERERVEKAERERIRSETAAAITRLVKETNAVDNWDRQLSKGQRYRLEPILTVELERLWMSGRPILFLGSIDDIKTHDPNSYNVVFSPSIAAIFQFMFDTELQLSLQCGRTDVDALLSAHPKLFEGAGFNNVVAVIADISTHPHRSGCRRLMKEISRYALGRNVFAPALRGTCNAP